MSLLRRKRRQRRVNEVVTQQTIQPMAVDNRKLQDFLATALSQPALGYRTTKQHNRVVIFQNPRSMKSTRKQMTKPNIDVNLAVEARKRRIGQENTVRNHLAVLGTFRPRINRVPVYDLPKTHPICKQRQERKEVLFATGKAGKGGQKPMKIPRLILRCK